MGLIEMKNLPDDVLSVLNKAASVYNATGSSYICEGRVTPKDYDFIVLSSSLWRNQKQLIDLGFVTSTKEYEAISNDFYSYRRGDVNLILTGKAKFFADFNKATKIAKRLKLDNKEDRISLFQAILYNNY